MLRIAGLGLGRQAFEVLCRTGLPASYTALQSLSSWSSQNESKIQYLIPAAAGLLGLSALAANAYADAKSPANASTSAGKLPSYTKAEVAKHTTPEQRIWVTYKDGVYDITDFIAQHPGGRHKIMLAAGGPVDPFWSMYQQHLKAEVSDILKEYRIGTLSDYSAGAAVAMPMPTGNPWGQEPTRHVALIKRSENPCNAETPGHLLAGNLVTPTDLFYVRNHLPVPHIDAKTYRLTVEGEGLRSIELDLQTLKTAFKKVTVAATVQCSGNRRNEMKAVKPVKGLDWDIGAIGTAAWGGVRLSDVLRQAGLDPDSPDAPLHIQFVGADTDPVSGDKYGASIPIEIAADSHRDVLLAYEMNGQPLSADHGFPVRVVVPGVAGARSVKWLTKIIASKDESSSHWQQRDYKSFSPSVDWDTVDWDSAPAIQDMPLTSAITEPLPGTSYSKADTSVTVRGYAWSGGGRDVVRVDVTSDGGNTWTTAELKKLPQRPGRAWAWTLWEADVPLPKGAKAEVELAVKATDSSYNSQPDSVASIWNLRGVVNNAWHRIKVKVDA